MSSSETNNPERANSQDSPEVDLPSPHESVSQQQSVPDVSVTVQESKKEEVSAQNTELQEDPKPSLCTVPQVFEPHLSSFMQQKSPIPDDKLLVESSQNIEQFTDSPKLSQEAKTLGKRLIYDDVNKDRSQSKKIKLIQENIEKVTETKTEKVVEESLADVASGEGSEGHNEEAPNEPDEQQPNEPPPEVNLEHDESPEEVKKEPMVKRKLGAKGRGVWAMMDSPDWDVCFLEDYFKLIVHALKNGKSDSPVQSNAFNVTMDDSVRRCHIMLFHTKIGKSSVFRALTEKYNDILKFAKFKNTAFIGGYEDVLTEISAAAALVTNASDIERVVDNQFSWEVASIKLNMSVRRLKPIFNIKKPKIETNKTNSDVFRRTCLLLTPSDMVQRHIPIPVGSNKSAYCTTKFSYAAASERSPLLALDTEDTEHPIRVTVVEETNEAGKNKTFMDVFIQSKEKHRTHDDFLGRFKMLRNTQEGNDMLKNIKDSVKDIRDELRTRLPEDAILVLHSAHNDLCAIEVCHPYIIESQDIYTSEANPNSVLPSLKELGEAVLNVQIQAGKHCSKEDSTTTMQLIEKKLQNSIQYKNQRLLSTLHEQIPLRPGEGTVLICASEETVKKLKEQVEELTAEAADDLLEVHKDISYFAKKINDSDDVIYYFTTITDKCQLTVTEFQENDDSNEICCFKICNIIEYIYSGLEENSLCVAFLLSDAKENVCLMSVK